MTREIPESLRASVEIKTDAAQKVQKDHIAQLKKFAREKLNHHRDGAVLGALATGGAIALEAVVSGQKARIISGIVAAGAAAKTTYSALKAVEFSSRSNSLEALELQLDYESITSKIERSETEKQASP